MSTNIEAGATVKLFLRDEQDRVLMLKHPDTPLAFENLWDLPGGKITKTRDVNATLLGEVGLECRDLTKLNTREFKVKQQTYTETMFCAYLDGPDDPSIPDSCREYRWVPIETVRSEGQDLMPELANFVRECDELYFHMPTYENVVNEYTKDWQEIYKDYANFLKDVLKELAKPINPLCIEGAREKSTASFAEKTLRKWVKYKGDPLKHMTDLAGGRIITNTQDEVKLVCAELETLFTIDWANTVDTSQRLGTSEFGYRSVHYIVEIPDNVPNILGIEVDDSYRGLKAEIQVRTLLEHAWSDVGHDRFYKSNYDVPKPLQRELAVCAAEMEQADKGLDSLCITLADQFEHYGIHRSKKDIDSEIQINICMLDVLKRLEDENEDPKTSYLQAITTYKLQLAELYIISGRWEEICELLHEFIEANPTPNRSLFMKFRKLWAIYGNACCHCDKSDEGEQYLKQAMLHYMIDEGDDPSDQQDDEQNNNPLARDRIHAQASVDLGRAYAFQDRRTSSRALECYRDAAEIDPQNPYILSHVLSALMRGSLDHFALHAMKPMLTAAIETCRQHIRVGISPWWSYFALGRLSLMAGEMYDALEAYSLGIRYYAANQHVEPQRFYNGELDFVRDLLKNFNDPNPLPYLCVEALIELASRGVSDTQPPEPRYTIIAGSTSTDKPLPIEVARNLRKALLKIENVTFLSGGTTSGVCGVVGEVLEGSVLAEVKGRGYLPASKWSMHDPRYGDTDQFTQTKAWEDFSPLESLNMWAELLAYGVSPKSVHVLGIGGGEISVFEYQLAAALGARVGVVLLNDNEPADRLPKNDLWHDVTEMFFLPTDAGKVAEEVLLMAAAHEPTLPEDIPVWELARKAHEAHNLVDPPKPEDKARANWEQLSEDLRDSNRQQTVYGQLVLRQGGYTITKADDGEEPQPPDFAADDQENFDRMARYEHARWMVERFTSGWRYADKKDSQKKLTPYLVPWDQLDSKIRKYDNDAIRNFAKNLCKCGYKVEKP